MTRTSRGPTGGGSILGGTGQPGVIEKVETTPQFATPWNVIIHDDPITLMVFVTMVLRQVFGYTQQKAQELMLEVHTSGRAIVWTGAREQAELYTFKLHAHQLLATCEPVSE